MKLKKNIRSSVSFWKEKLENFQFSNLKKGDYIRLYYLSFNQKRRGGENFRINKQTVILYKKKRRKQSLSLVVFSLYHHERVKIRYLVNSPHLIKIVWIQKKN